MKTTLFLFTALTVIGYSPSPKAVRAFNDNNVTLSCTATSINYVSTPGEIEHPGENYSLTRAMLSITPPGDTIASTLTIQYGSSAFYTSPFFGKVEKDLTLDFVKLWSEKDFVSGNRFILSIAQGSALVQNTSATLSLTYSKYANAIDRDIAALGIDLVDLYKKTVPQILTFSSYLNTKGKIQYQILVYHPNITQKYNSLNLYYASENTPITDDDFFFSRVDMVYNETNQAGKIHRYALNEFTLQEAEYRSFKITKLNYNNSAYDTFDARFDFHYRSDGSYDYATRSFDYVEIKDEQLHGLFVEENADGWIGELFRPVKGSYNHFLGFNVKNYTIDDLQEVEVTYQSYNLEAITANRNLSYGFFDNRTVQSYVDKGELSGNRLDNAKKITPIKKNVTTGFNTISPKSIEVINDGFFAREKYTWNSIMDVKKLDSYCDEKTKTNLLKWFKDNEFIVLVQAFPTTFSATTLEIAVGGIVPTPMQMAHKLLNCNILSSYCPLCWWMHDTAGYAYEPTLGTKAQVMYSQGIDQAEIVRMKFLDVDKNPYNLSVISKPVDSSGDASQEHDKEIPDFNDLIKDLESFLNKIGEIGQVIFGILIFLLIIFVFGFIRKLWRWLFPKNTHVRRRR